MGHHAGRLPQTKEKAMNCGRISNHIAEDLQQSVRACSKLLQAFAGVHKQG